MTISDFLKLPNFTDLRLLAGKYGLLSEVTNVTVVDTPDGTNCFMSFMRKYLLEMSLEKIKID